MDWSLEDGLKAVKKMQVRTSCRGFQDKEIPGDLLDEIFAAALQAPSGGNLQPVTVVNVTDTDLREKMMALCGNQKFIGEAPVNLVFFIDWHKMSVFAKNEKAPFTCDDSYMHYLIAVEDVMCMAQIIETAAWLCGLGSCYVGTVNSVGGEISELLHMPKGTYPVVMLSLGYPKQELKKREKLNREMMIFENAYPKEIDDAYIIDQYRMKYGDMATPLPKDADLKEEMLAKFKDALLMNYTPEEAEEIILKASENGKINETQRRFGLHYHARTMRVNGRGIIKQMEKQKLTPFRMED